MKKMNDQHFLEWLQNEAIYCAERATSIKDISKKQYWIGRQNAYENTWDKYKQLTDNEIDEMGKDYEQN